MEKTVDLELDNDEEILAKGVKGKFYFLFMLISTIFYCSIVGFAIVFIPIGVAILEKCFLLATIILVIGIEVWNYNSYKNDYIYITNKKFIIIIKNKVEIVPFNEIKNIDYIGTLPINAVLRLKNKRKFIFHSINIDEVYKTFTKIYPQWKSPKTSITKIVICFLLIALMTIFQFWYACKLKNEQNKKNEVIENITEDSDAQTYMNYLQSTMYSNWKPPRLKNSTKVVTFFEIAPDGTILNEKILQSSGNKEMDDSALLAIRKISPIKKLPKALLKETPTVQFTFDYNVYKH